MNEIIAPQVQLSGDTLIQGVVNSQKSIFESANMSDGAKLVAYGMTVVLFLGVCWYARHSSQSSDSTPAVSSQI